MNGQTDLYLRICSKVKSVSMKPIIMVARKEVWTDMLRHSLGALWLGLLGKWALESSGLVTRSCDSRSGKEQTISAMHRLGMCSPREICSTSIGHDSQEAEEACISAGCWLPNL